MLFFNVEPRTLNVKPLALHPKLPEVMIEVFVHGLSPLILGEGAEHRVRVLSYVSLSPLIKCVDQHGELRSFFFKILLIGDPELGSRRKILFPGIVVV